MRATDLIFYLAGREAVSTDELRERFSVSVRTVRTCIKKANEQLVGFASVTYRHALGGYCLSVTDPGAFQAWRQRVQVLERQGELAAEPEGRLLFIAGDLLLRDTWVTVAHYSELLYVSPQSISADLKRVEDFIGTYGLTLARRPHYGIRIEGSELSRRLCLASVVASERDVHFDADALTVGRRGELAAVVQKALHADGFKVIPSAFDELIVQIAIAVERMRQGCFVPMESATLMRISALREQSVARRIAASIEESFGVSFPSSEIAYLTILLAGKRLGGMEAPAPSASTDPTITDEAQETVERIFEIIYREFHVDFRDDDELRLNLGMHVAPLLIRLRYRMQLENPLIYDIRESFPLAYLMAHAASAVFTEQSDAVLSEDEMGYIALAFALALERKQGSSRKRRVLALYAASAGSGRMLEHCLRRDFASYIETLDLRDRGELDEVDLSAYDCIFTTDAIPGDLGVPVLEVNPFFSESERRHIEDFLKVGTACADVILPFRPALFCPHLRSASKDEAIAELCRRTRDVIELPPEFEAYVAKREALAPTAFGNLAALPHPSEAITEQTFVTVGILDEPVPWWGKRVQVVFLLSIARQAGDELGDFYTAMVRLLTSDAGIERLIRERRFETLLDELLKNRGKGMSHG